LYPDLVAIGILFGYGIKAILIPVFVICEQDIPQKKKKKKKKKEEGSHAANNVTAPSTCCSKETLSLDARKEGRLSVLCPRTCS
jgi:hypothetical protein